MSRAEWEKGGISIVRAIHASAQQHQWQAALELVHLQLHVKPDVICYGASMNACVRAVQWQCAHVGDLDGVIHLAASQSHVCAAQT